MAGFRGGLPCAATTLGGAEPTAGSRFAVVEVMAIDMTNTTKYVASPPATSNASDLGDESQAAERSLPRLRNPTSGEIGGAGLGHNSRPPPVAPRRHCLPMWP